MFFWSRVVPLFLLATPALAADDIIPEDDEVIYVPNAYIVELNPSSELLSPGDHLKRSVDIPDYEVRQEFTNDSIFYGLSLTLSDERDIDALRESPEVKDVFKVQQVRRPEPDNVPLSELSAAGIDGNFTLPNYRSRAQVNRPLEMGNVIRLHDRGIKGKGVQIAVIDSGIDYRHPALGGGFGPGFKVALGYDFVGDAYIGSNAPVPGPDPLTTCASGGHGTHTAGIIGMQDPDDQGFGLVGVAPEATLAIYRTFGCSGSSASDVIMSAMQRAAEEGADIISMSLGSRSYWESTSAYTAMINRLRDQGVVVIAAAGNDGRSGPYTIGAPGITPSAFAIGSIENDVIPVAYRAHDDAHNPIDYMSTFPMPEDKPMDIFWLGSGLNIPINDTVANGCRADVWQAAAAAITDTNSTIVLIADDGVCAKGNGVNSAQRIGISTVAFYTSRPQTFVSQSAPVSAVRILTLDYNNSLAITKAIAATPVGKPYRLRFDDARPRSLTNAFGGAMSTFSSIGPSVEMSLNPQVSGPGGNILATWPLSVGGYAVISGTSMATPYVAGVYALLKSQRPDLSITELTGLLQSTAKPVKAFQSDLLATTAHQGGGMVDAFAAVRADSRVEPSEFNLRDSSSPSSRNITITNNARSQKTFTLSHDGAAYLRLFPDWSSGNLDLAQRWRYVAEPKAASGKFSSSSLTLGPGQSATIEIQITPDVEKTPASHPFYSGFVKIASDTYTHTIPYVGVPFDRTEVPMIPHDQKQQVGNDLPAVFKMTAGSAIRGQPKPNIDEYIYSTANVQYTYPNYLAIATQPTRFWRLEIVPANTTFEPTFYGFDPAVKIEYESSTTPLTKPVFGVDTYGWIGQGGLGVLPVPSYTASYFSSAILFRYTAFGSPILTTEDGDIFFGSGDYRPLLRVLKWQGNSTDPADYESWLGPVIRYPKA